MQTLTNTAFAATGRRTSRPIGLRLLDWLVALDAGYRNAHKLAFASDERLADMGIARSEAETEFESRFGTPEYRRPIGSRW
jgi:uncharacterized protein YjiS (DUF1127 family)